MICIGAETFAPPFLKHTPKSVIHHFLRRATGTRILTYGLLSENRSHVGVAHRSNVTWCGQTQAIAATCRLAQAKRNRDQKGQSLPQRRCIGGGCGTQRQECLIGAQAHGMFFTGNPVAGGRRCQNTQGFVAIVPTQKKYAAVSSGDGARIHAQARKTAEFGSQSLGFELIGLRCEGLLSKYDDSEGLMNEGS